MPRAAVNKIQIQYETFGDPNHPALLLIMGLGGQLTSWDGDWRRELASQGLYVICYDNRDVGLSSKMDHAPPPDILKLLSAKAAGLPFAAPYTIADMADDAVGLLDALEIEKAHLCGMSMGGMIAQTAAINHPSRLLSLISIYSSTGNPSQPLPTPEALEVISSAPPLEREAYIDYAVNNFRVISGPGFPFDEQWVRSLTARSYDRSFSPEGVGRQLAALMTQEDRRPGLAGLKIPTLVIHGSDDPLVRLECGRETAQAIPGAELLVIEGMGHDLPHGGAWPQVGRAVAAHAVKSNP